MKLNFFQLRNFALSISLIILINPWATGQKSLIKQVKLENFDFQSSYIVQGSGKEISDSNYHSKQYWFPVKVPTTVLRGLVANRIYPDPYLGLNNMQIPDASDSFNTRYNLGQYSFIPEISNPWKKPYWFINHFTVPKSDKGKFFQLIFKGINYRAEVWLNGNRIADSSKMVGMFAEFNLEVSKAIRVGQINNLAVKIFPLDFPGLPSEEQLKALGPFFDNGGPTGDIGKNVTMLCSAGWDWIPPVRDRNMGIWQPVYLRTTGGVTIGHPQLKTSLPNLPDTSVAHLSLDLNLSNYSSQIQKGELKIRISPENFLEAAPIELSKTAEILANSTKKLELNDQSFNQLILNRPHLWWPNNYGKPNLYRIRIQFLNQSGISDDTTFLFGIRTTESKFADVKGFGRREFFVNGKKIHLVGGAWVPDMLVNRDSARFDRELDLCRNANVNLVRIWGGGITPPDAFFESADKYGLLVWSDFWITGDTNGEFKGSSDYPLEGSVFIRNVISTILRIRNHPSLLVWTGGNEGHARKELYDAMRSQVINLDGTRPFIPSSSGFAKLPPGWKGSFPDNNYSGVYSGGPYSWQDPHEYYRLVDAGKDWLFKDETGIPSQPPFNSLAKNIPNLIWDPTLPYPLNHTWGYHDAATGNGHYELYYQEMVKRFGEPTSLEDFSNKMQLLNAIGYQGIFESVNHKINETGGVMLWKLNAAFPSVIWQIYDWYLEPNAGYFLMQNACEPVHIQLNLNDSTVALINRGQNPTTNLFLETKVFNMDSKLIFSKLEPGSSLPVSAKEFVPLASILKKSKGINFIILNLKNEKGNIISHNSYQLSPENNFTKLHELKPVRLLTQVISTIKNVQNLILNLQIENPTDQIAFFIRPQLMVSQEEVLPSFWSASYFTLAPHERIKVEVRAGLDILKGKKPSLKVSGWNVPIELTPVRY